MKKSKYFLLIILCICCIGLLTGCAKKEKTPNTNNSSETIKSDENNTSSIKDSSNSNIDNWIYSYDWDNCKKKNVSSIKLYGKYEFPCNIYDIFNQDFEPNIDALYIVDEEENEVTITSSDIKRNDLFLENGSISGKLDNHFISIETNDDNKRHAAIGDAFAHDDWELYMDNFASVVLDLDSNYNLTENEILDKVLNYLGRPDYVYYPIDIYKRFSKDNIKDLKVEYELIWMLDDIHYFSIVLGEKPYSVEVSDYTHVGCMQYLENKKIPTFGTKDMYEFIDFDEIVEMVKDAKKEN